MLPACEAVKNRIVKLHDAKHALNGAVAAYKAGERAVISPDTPSPVQCIAEIKSCYETISNLPQVAKAGAPLEFYLKDLQELELSFAQLSKQLSALAPPVEPKKEGEGPHS